MTKQRGTRTLRPQSNWVYYAGAHVYSWSEYLDEVIPLGLADLSAEGYVEVDLTSATQVAALKGQLARVITVSDATTLIAWAPRGAMEHVARFPVVLAFRMPSITVDGATTLPALQQVPPQSLGECALVWDGQAWQLVERSELGPEGITLQVHLADAIMEMVGAAAEWWTVAGATAALADEQQREGIEAHLADLTALTRRRRQSPARWEAQWQGLRRQTAELAEYYWLQTQSETRLAVVNVETVTVSVPADAMTQQIMRSLLSAGEYIPDAEQRVAVWQPTLLAQPVTIQLNRQDGETYQQMMAVLDQLGDEAADAFCALVAIALDTNGSKGIAQPFYLSPDDVLAFLGRHESNRAYTAGQRAMMITLLNVLARIQVSAVLPNPRRKNRVYRMTSTIVNLLSDTIGEYVLDSGEILWQRRKVSLGNWAAVAPQLSSQTVEMLRRILSYHPQKDRYAKRLGRFLTLQFTTATATLEFSMSQLIAHAGIPVDRSHPDRTRRFIEGAFAELIHDQILGSATMLIEAGSAGEGRQRRIAQCIRGWWEDYEATIWQFTPPVLVPRLEGEMRV
ncbi:MAG: hypothetical protein H0X24_01765 [Ktedonobacterales bacterium]|nr:hypothetical protein [Ktedonobacterales bacterium]